MLVVIFGLMYIWHCDVYTLLAGMAVPSLCSHAWLCYCLYWDKHVTGFDGACPLVGQEMDVCLLFVTNCWLPLQRLSKIYGDCFLPLLKPHLEELAVDSLVWCDGVRV